MNMRKVICFALVFLLGVTASVNAQVNIGSQKDAHSGALLELDVESGKKGLLLPRVEIADVNVWGLDGSDESVAGMVVFNTGDNKVYVWNGEKWAQVGEPPVAIAVNGISVSPKTVILTTINATQQLTATITPSNATNQTVTWLSSNPKIAAVSPTGLVVAAANGQTIIAAVTADGGKAAIIEVTVGCGAKTVNGDWLVFMCHNLGADPSLDPFVYKSNGDNVDFDIKGSLYQWGRPSDGHEKRNSGTTTTLATSNTPGHADFIMSNDWRSGGNEISRWGDGTTNANQPKAVNDPCPAGWKVPSQAQWGSIFRGGTTSGASATATANTWSWTGNGYKVGSGLFLPAVGSRDYHSALLNNAGSIGAYWSSTVTSTNSYDLVFNSDGVMPAFNDARGYGLSVRCVSE